MSGYSPLEPITLVDTINTFDDWRVLTNQTISRVNNATASNTDADYSELISRLVVRDEFASFVANDITGNNFTSNVSSFFLANGEQSHTNTSLTNSGYYVGYLNTGTGAYDTDVVNPLTDPSGIRSLVCRTTDAILLPRGTAGEAPINAEPGMLRYDTTVGTLTYWNPSTISWKTLGGGELADRDVDTVITVETAPGTDEDTISMYVGNTGSPFPIFTLNAVTTNTSVNAVFRDFVLFEKDVTVSGNLTLLGQQTSLDTATLAVEDKRINLGLVNGLRNECRGLQDATNLRIRMPDLENTSGTGAQVPHGLNAGDLVWVTNINDILNMTEGLYVVESVHDIYEFTVENVDGSAIGCLVGTFSPSVSWSGPQNDVAVNGGGFVLPGNTEHSLQWMDSDQYFVFSDNLRVDNTGAFGLPSGNTDQRPSQSVGTGSGSYIGDHKGLIRYNTELNTVEALITGGGGGATRTWVDVRGMIDSDDTSDTFINVYGNHQTPTALVSAPGHTLNDIVFVTQNTERFFIDALGYAHFTSNAGLVIPKGTTAEQPRFPSLDTGANTTSHTDPEGDGMQVGMIRFNTQLNVYEGVFADDSSTDGLRFMPLASHGIVDTGSNSANNTFLNIYGNDSDPFSHDPSGTHVGIQGNAVHTLDDVVLTIAGTKRFFVDSTGWAAFTSNGVLGIPRGTTAERPSTVAGGYDAGFIRFNTTINSFEGVLADGTTWAGLGGVVDSADGADTFINVYGNATDPTGIVADGNHVLNDMTFVTNASEEFMISANGWIHAHTSANSVFVLPIGNTTQRPASTDNGYMTGAIRFNTELNSYEGVIADGTTWAGLGGVVDSADGGDTFLNVYGNAGDPTAITPDGSHVLNDIVMVTGGSEEMMISANGYIHAKTSANSVFVLPIGTTAQRPTAGNGYQAGAIRFNTSINSYEGVLADGTTWAGLGGVVDSANDGDTFIQVYGHASDATSITPDSAHNENDMVFVTNSNHIMTVTHGTSTTTGNIYIGDTFDDTSAPAANAPDAKLKINGTVNATGAVQFTSSLRVDGIGDFNSTMDITGNTAITANLAITNNVAVSDSLSISNILDIGGTLTVGGDCEVDGYITADGDITAFASSDINFKKNILDIPSALDKVKKMRGVTFDFKEGHEVPGRQGRQVGVIAQEVQEAMPELVVTRQDGSLAVDYERICAVLIESVKELNDEIQKLKNEKDMTG